MILLVSGATRSVFDPTLVGALIVPGAWNKPDYVIERELYWGADNGAYSGFDEAAYIRMLAAWRDVPRCLFVTAPDVVGDAKTTRELFFDWEPRLRQHHGVHRVAFVAQDGCEELDIPWSKFESLFVGGTDAFKLSKTATDLCYTARLKDKWVHVGRVNTIRRMMASIDRGAHSIDGSKFSRWPNTWIPQFAKLMNNEKFQLKFHSFPPGPETHESSRPTSFTSLEISAKGRSGS